MVKFSKITLLTNYYSTGLMKKQAGVGQEDRFKGTILDPVDPSEQETNGYMTAKIKIEGGPGPSALS